MRVQSLVLVLLLAPTVFAQSSPISVVCAADYRPVIAPDSIASIFGADLAGSTRVEVNGQAAELLFVSFTQINFVVPSDIPSGTATVSVRTTETAAPRNAAVQVSGTVPALFSRDASGTGPGAILNAVTFQPAPFLTATAVNNELSATRLAAYGTGFRHANAVSALAIDPSGNRFPLVVESAGAAPGFPGLDQLNFVVPPGLDGAGTVSLTIATEDGVSNSVTFQMNLLPADLLQLAGLVLTPQVVVAGDYITATVLLNGVARTGGFFVTLRSTNPVAQPSTFVTIPEGSASVPVLVTTATVSNVQTGVISAQASGVTLSATFEIDPRNQIQLGGISVVPGSTLGGRTLQATVALTGPAPAGGLIVQIASDNAAARPPDAVTVLYNQSSTTFPIPTVAVSSPQNVIIAALFNGTVVTSKVQVLPLLTLTIDPNPVIGGTPATGSVTLADPAPLGGAVIALNSIDPVIARVPVLLTIAAGRNFNTFNIVTSQVSVTRTFTISASYMALTASAPLTVNPPPPPTLTSLVISPDQIPGGQSTQGTITLAGPARAGGVVVALQSSAPLIAQVPGLVIIPEGFTTAIFSIKTTRVPLAEIAVITATAGGFSRTAALTVQ